MTLTMTFLICFMGPGSPGCTEITFPQHFATYDRCFQAGHAQAGRLARQWILRAPINKVSAVGLMCSMLKEDDKEPT